MKLTVTITITKLKSLQMDLHSFVLKFIHFFPLEDPLKLLSFSQTHKIGNIGIIAIIVFPYICSFLPYLYLFCKSKIRYQCVYEEYISGLHIIGLVYF